MNRVAGIVFTAVIAYVGVQSSHIIGTNILGLDKSPISGIMMAIIVGLIIGNTIQIHHSLKPGIQFSLKYILRLGIILLGIRLSLGDVYKFGTLALPLIILCISGAVFFTRWLGRKLALSSNMSILVAVGTSICGATAIVATGPAIEAKEEEIAYAVANITVFGLIAMFLYPYLAHALFGNDMTGSGLYLGTAIHETAQVAGSGLIYSQLFDAPEALDIATVTKLIRNVFIAVLIPLMVFQKNRLQQNETETDKKAASFFSLFPTFIFGFLLMAAFRSIGDLTLDSGNAWGIFGRADWNSLIEFIKEWAENFLAMAMAGVGASTSIRELRKLGFKPFYVGLGASVSVGVISLLGIATLQVLNLY